MPVRLLMVDNADSFTFMLVDYLRMLGAEVEVARSDMLSAAGALDGAHDAIVISPGPGRAEEAGCSVALASACIASRKPLLGVCLGHQALALACGGAVERVAPVHGRTSDVRHDGTGLFAELPSPMTATRYHSLAVVDPVGDLVANAWSEDGVVMGMRHVDGFAHGVQFHPESIASTDGMSLLSGFIGMVAATT